MAVQPKLHYTPGGNQSTRHTASSRQSDSGEPRGKLLKRKSESSLPTYIGTLNINTLLQTGKLHHLTTELDRQHIKIAALQETRYTDELTMDYGKFRIFKGKTARRVGRGGTPLLGMAFLVHKDAINTVKEVTPVNERLMTMRIRTQNKHYTFINTHAPVNKQTKKQPESTEKFWNTLEKTLSKIHKNDVKILLGDFNAQIGREKYIRNIAGGCSAHHNTNCNGLKLVELCRQFNLKIMTTHFRGKPNKKKTWRSPIQSLGEYQIDHIAISREHYRTILDIKVRRGANIDSDHYLTRAKVKFTPRKRPSPKQTPQKLDIQKIHTSNIQEEWEKIPTDNWPDFQKKIMQTARQIIPLKRKSRHPWWNQECEDAIEERKLALKKYATKKSDETLKEFLKIRKQAAKTIRQIKRRYIHEQLDSIEQDFRNYNSHNFYRTFANQIKGYQPQSLCFRKPDKTMALTNMENCELLAQYFDSLLNCPPPPERFSHIYREPTTPPSPPPTTEEIRRHIQRLKNNRTSGEDGIVAELLKNLGKNTIKELTEIIHKIWNTEKVPEEWRYALIHPLFKKGDRTDVNNYRGISLLQVTYKILSACLLERVQTQLEGKIGEYQAGFRPHRSCSEQIFNLKTTLRIRALSNKPTVCTFVDFKKAYDSVDRTSLFNILNELGLDTKTLNLVKATLTETYSKVKFMGEISRPFKIETGVRQGDGLSPLLFNLVLDKVIREWNAAPITLGRSGITIKCLAFADDLAVLADTEEQAIQQIETLKECAEKVGLQISFEKTEYMSTYKTDTQKLQTKYGTINRVTKFKYLGEIIQPTGIEKETQKTRIEKVRKAYGVTANIYNKKNLGIHTKIKHYNTVIKPAILYASETIASNKGDMEALKKEERRIIRKIIGPKLTDEGYRLQSRETTEELSNIENDIRKRRLKFYGHISRLPDSRLTKKMLNSLQKRKVSTKWMKQVTQDLEAANIIDTQERTTFRQQIHKWEVKKETKKKTGTSWTEERKQAHSQKMREIWANKKRLKTMKT